jgi:hypothetical protein
MDTRTMASVRKFEVPCFMLVINFILVTLLDIKSDKLWFCSYSVAVSPCEGHVLIHDSSSIVRLYKLDTWEFTSQWDLVPPQQWKWRKHPMVFRSSRAYVAGAEGQLSVIKARERLLSHEQIFNGGWLHMHFPTCSYSLFCTSCQRSNLRIGCKFRFLLGLSHSLYSNNIVQVSASSPSYLAMAVTDALSPAHCLIKVSSGE